VKLSQTNDILELIKKAGIHEEPQRLSRQELEQLASDPEIRKKILQLFCSDNRNIYQELEMDSPYVNTHRDISFSPDSVQLHSHSFYEIIFCESGNIQYLINARRYHIHPGDILLLPPGTSHRPLFYDRLETPYSRIVLWISTEYFRTLVSLSPSETVSRLRSLEHFILRTEGTPYKYLEDFFRRGLHETEVKAPLWELSLYANTLSLLVHISRALLHAPKVYPLQNREEIDRIISYIEKNYGSKITLEETARRFNISTSTLSKLFYSKLEISFYHFVTQRRLIHSKLRIEQGDSMEETALTCGFSDYSAFYRSFKKEFGISPREYKKLVTHSIEA